VYDIVLYGINFSVSDSAFFLSTATSTFSNPTKLTSSITTTSHRAQRKSGNIEIAKTNWEVQMTISGRNAKPVVTIHNSRCTLEN